MPEALAYVDAAVIKSEPDLTYYTVQVLTFDFSCAKVIIAQRRTIKSYATTFNAIPKYREFNTRGRPANK